jgi:hypothetical protein
MIRRPRQRSINGDLTMKQNAITKCQSGSDPNATSRPGSSYLKRGIERCHLGVTTRHRGRVLEFR